MSPKTISDKSHQFFLRLSKQEWALIAITIFWGATFSIVQRGVSVSSPFYFVGLRFACATVITAFVFRHHLQGIRFIDWLAGICIGISIYLGYSLQTMGLETIPSSQSAFITALYVPLVPLMQWMFLRKPPSLMNWLGIGLAFIGLVFISGQKVGHLSLGFGEIITIISTVIISLEIILISYFAERIQVRSVTVIQLGVASVLSLLTAAPMGEPMPTFSWTLFWCIAVLGAGSGVIQLAMNWAQRSLSATRVTLIYTGEPVWAGIIGRALGERLPATAFLGAFLIVVGVLVSELKFTIKKRSSS